MNVKPLSASVRAACPGSKSICIPQASRTSALPQALEAARFPCLATGTPAAATVSAVIVEMLIVLALSPPVPTTSTTSGRPCSTCRLRPRIARAAPAISSYVSPRAASEVSRPAAWTALKEPSMISPIMDAASSSLRRSPPRRRRSKGAYSIEHAPQGLTNKLYDRELCRISRPHARLGDARVPSRPALERGRDLLDELFHDGGLGQVLGHQPARVQVAAGGGGD